MLQKFEIGEYVNSFEYMLKGCAFNTGDVYFDTQSIGSRYGKLANMGNASGESGRLILYTFQ